MTKLRLTQSFRSTLPVSWQRPSAARVSFADAQQVFKTPEDAATALASAVKSGAPRDILKVFGRDAVDIMVSGDEVADREARERFIKAYDAGHNVVVEGDKASLVIGADNFPFPVPLTRQKAGWKFDTAAGRLEILYRRIGRNELDAFRPASLMSMRRTSMRKRIAPGPAPVFMRSASSVRPARKTVFTGPHLMAMQVRSANSSHRPRPKDKAGEGRTPYHGYYYRILTQQGPNAPGGTLNYVVKGKMIGGYALLAYPAEYGNSGVMTFLVNHSGTVYQKDLGDYTMRLVGRMMWFDPDQTWKKVDVPGR